MNDKVEMIKVSDLHPFPDNPFGVRQDEAMKMLTQSVKEYGILSPILARKVENGYEVISGHRRLTAAREAGLIELPVIVQECDRDQAVIMLVDSNLQRPELLPSEKAFAFKMKNEALKRKAGRYPNGNCAQPEHNFIRGRTIDLYSGSVVKTKTLLNISEPDIAIFLDCEPEAILPVFVLSHRRRRRGRLRLASLTERLEAATIVSRRLLNLLHIFESLTVGTFFQRLHAGLSRMADGCSVSMAYSCAG